MVTKNSIGECTPITNTAQGGRGDRGVKTPRRGRGGGTPAAAALILALCCAPAWAQSETVDILYRLTIDEEFYLLGREAGVYIWDAYAGPFPVWDYWDYSFRNALGSVSNAARLLPCDKADGADEQRLRAEAAAKGVPVIIDVRVDGVVNSDNPRTTVSYTILDAFNRLRRLDKTLDMAIPTEPDLFTHYWINAAADLEAFIEPILRPKLLITGPVGAVVRGVTEEALVIPEPGALEVDAPMPAVFRWEMSHWNYAERQGLFFAERDHFHLDLPRQPFHHFSVDAALFQGRIPEADLSFSLKSYGWFFSLGLTQQVFGLALQDDAGALETSFSVRPLFVPRIGAGYRFPSREPRIPKLYLRALGGLRLDYQRGGFDQFSPFSLAAAAGYDWELTSHFRLFFEAGLGLYIL
ncbi:MAG: hypothetical protein LBD08_07960, partial [Treponema sp.]|nr:hypothetical protein [Treponema sp.]